MPATAGYVKDLIDFIINKHQDGNITPNELNMIMKQANASYQSFLIGEVQQQQYGKAIPRVALGQNDKIYQSLSPFISPPTTLTLTNGVADVPTDFQAWVNMSTADGNDIRFVQKDRWNNWKNSVIDVPTTSKPIYTINMDGFSFFPTTAVPLLTYIQTAPAFVWAFTEDEQEREVYDAANSTGLLWFEKDILEVISRALSYIGINLQSAAVEQFANQVNATGQ